MNYQRKDPLDYKDIAENLKNPAWWDLENGAILLDDAATAVTDLLDRAESAEARCETLEKMVKEYQEELIPGYRERAEKAKRERDALLKEFAGECGMCVHYEDCTQNHYSCCDGADWEWIGLKEE